MESDSFITVVEALPLIKALPDESDDWEDLEEVDQEYRLRLAAQMMGYLMLRGRRVFCRQGLCFPRTPQGNVYEIPWEAKETQAYISYSVVHRGLANRPTATTEAITGTRVTNVSLGGLLAVSFSGKPLESGTGLDALIRNTQFPAFVTMKRWLTQIRGGSVIPADEVTCLTTTTTTSPPATTTTTTTSSTTTTT